jgi:phosphoesterase RecJ-like protein
MKEKYKKIDLEIKRAKKILILTHRAPDGDAIGSVLALNIYLKKQRKNTYVYSSSVPNYLGFLPNYDLINKKPPQKDDFDLIFALDYADAKRIDLPPNFEMDKKRLISIDHHISGERVGKICAIGATASSVSEMLYDFFKYKKIKIDKNISNCLLTGIFTDTVGFSRLDNAKNTKNAVADLLKGGANIKAISANYHKLSFLQAKILERMLQRSEYDKKLNFIYSWISYKDFSELNKSLNKDKKQKELFLQEPPIFPDFLAKIGTANVYALFIELKKEKIKASLRSSGVDVAIIAEKFKGGGHKEASGFFTKGSVSGAVKKVKRELKKAKK